MGIFNYTYIYIHYMYITSSQARPSREIAKYHLVHEHLGQLVQEEHGIPQPAASGVPTFRPERGCIVSFEVGVNLPKFYTL